MHWVTTNADVQADATASNASGAYSQTASASATGGAVPFSAPADGGSSSSNGNGHMGADSRPALGTTGGMAAAPGMSRCASHTSHMARLCCK